MRDRPGAVFCEWVTKTLKLNLTIATILCCLPCVRGLAENQELSPEMRADISKLVMETVPNAILKDIENSASNTGFYSFVPHLVWEQFRKKFSQVKTTNDLLNMMNRFESETVGAVTNRLNQSDISDTQRNHATSFKSHARVGVKRTLEILASAASQIIRSPYELQLFFQQTQDLNPYIMQQVVREIVSPLVRAEDKLAFLSIARLHDGFPDGITPVFLESSQSKETLRGFIELMQPPLNAGTELTWAEQTELAREILRLQSGPVGPRTAARLVQGYGLGMEALSETLFDEGLIVVPTKRGSEGPLSWLPDKLETIEPFATVLVKKGAIEGAEEYLRTVSQIGTHNQYHRRRFVENTLPSVFCEGCEFSVADGLRLAELVDRVGTHEIRNEVLARTLKYATASTAEEAQGLLNLVRNLPPQYSREMFYITVDFKNRHRHLLPNLMDRFCSYFKLLGSKRAN